MLISIFISSKSYLWVNYFKGEEYPCRYVFLFGESFLVILNLLCSLIMANLDYGSDVILFSI